MYLMECLNLPAKANFNLLLVWLMMKHDDDEMREERETERRGRKETK